MKAKNTIIAVLAASFLAAVFTPSAQGTLLMYDGFDYPTGDLPSPWVASGTGDAIQVQSPTLSVSGLEAPTGGSATFQGGGMDYDRTFSSVTNGSIFYSFAFQVTDISAFTQAGYLAALINQSNITNLRGTFWLVPDTSSQFDIAFGAATNAPPNTNTPILDLNLSLNTTYYVVAEYDMTINQASFWFAPDSSTFGDAVAPAATISGLTSSLPAEFTGFFLRQDSGGKTPTVIFDELRIGTTWADVTPAAVPEPASGTMLLGAFGLLALRRPRRR